MFLCNALFQSVILSTIPHPAIAATTDPVMADSFPMIAGLRTRLGSNLVGEFSWQYSVTTNGRGRSIGRGGSSASDMMNIRKPMVVNGKNLLKVFYDKLQKREVLHAEETQVILNTMLLIIFFGDIYFVKNYYHNLFIKPFYQPIFYYH